MGGAGAGWRIAARTRTPREQHPPPPRRASAHEIIQPIAGSPYLRQHLRAVLYIIDPTTHPTTRRGDGARCARNGDTAETPRPLWGRDGEGATRENRHRPSGDRDPRAGDRHHPTEPSPPRPTRMASGCCATARAERSGASPNRMASGCCATARAERSGARLRVLSVCFLCAFCVDYGWIMGGFMVCLWRILGGFWVDFGWILGGLWVDLWCVYGGFEQRFEKLVVPLHRKQSNTNNYEKLQTTRVAT